MAEPEDTHCSTSDAELHNSITESVVCSKGCGESITVQDLPDHLESCCPRREFACVHCGCRSTYESITTKHYQQCAKYPLACPNSCQILSSIPRYQLSEHLQECPLQRVVCELSHAGCKAQPLRKDLAKHMEEDAHSHLILMCKLTLDLKLRVERQENTIKTLQENVECLTRAFPVVPINISMPRYCKNKERRISWLSFPFYTHTGGYKMCIKVYSAGHGEGRNNCVSVYCVLLQGEYDQKLRWPLKAKVTLQLLSVEGDDVHGSTDAFTFNRVVRGSMRGEQGWPRFISHSEAESDKYKDRNKLHFRVAVEVLGS